MLLNEFLKEHRKVEEQGATIARLQKQVKTPYCGPTESERSDGTEQGRTANSAEQSVKLPTTTTL
jgi:hypothetical protein